MDQQLAGRFRGPRSTRADYDPLGQVVSGLVVGEGSLAAPVMAPTFTFNDYLAAAGVTSALLKRARRRQLPSAC